MYDIMDDESNQGENVNALIDSAEKYIGVPYVFGGKTVESGLDCSGLITLALADIGIKFPHGSVNQVASEAGVTTIPVDVGVATPGALLYKPGHIAISRGDGTTIEARNPKDGIGNFTAYGRGWTTAVTINALTGGNENRMISPVEGRVSSEYGYRTLGGKRSLHAGIDIATGKVGIPVYAPFAGKIVVLVSNRVHDTSSSQWKNLGKKTLAPGRSGNGVRIQNPDNEQQLLGHVAPASGLKVGTSVKKGQLLGHIDLSGNTTGPHLHLEMWNSGGTPRNPRNWFNYHGVTPGSKPNVSAGGSTAGSTVKEYQKRQNTYANAGLLEDGIKGSSTLAWEAWVKTLQTALRNYNGVSNSLPVDGDYGKTTSDAVKVVQRRNNMTVDGIAGESEFLPFMRKQGSTIAIRPGSTGGSSNIVKQYQARQNKYAEAGLVEDGVRGPVVIKWETWAKDAQNSINSFKSSLGKLIVDGDYGSSTSERVKDVQRRNSLVVDGIIGPVMIKWMRSKGSNIGNRP